MPAVRCNMNWRKLLIGSLLALGLLTAVGVNAQSPTATYPSCPGDRVVWVNTNSGVYHYQGERYFGNTKQGKFACEKQALGEGDRPTRNGQ